MIQIVALLHSRQDGLSGLREYERAVLPLLAEHGGRLLSAFRPEWESDETPDEIRLLEFPSKEAPRSYRNDPRLEHLSDLRKRSISRPSVYVSSGLVDY